MSLARRSRTSTALVRPGTPRSTGAATSVAANGSPSGCRALVDDEHVGAAHPHVGDRGHFGDDGQGSGRGRPTSQAVRRRNDRRGRTPRERRQRVTASGNGDAASSASWRRSPLPVRRRAVGDPKRARRRTTASTARLAAHLLAVDLPALFEHEANRVNAHLGPLALVWHFERARRNRRCGRVTPARSTADRSGSEVLDDARADGGAQRGVGPQIGGGQRRRHDEPTPRAAAARGEHAERRRALRQHPTLRRVAFVGREVRRERALHVEHVGGHRRSRP